MPDKLKPSPFCGAKPEFYTDSLRKRDVKLESINTVCLMKSYDR